MAYLDEVLLLYSEIDPALHAAVAAGQYGPGMPMTSTIDYHPTFFLINGAPFDPTVAGSNEFPVTQNNTALLRLLNAGLKSHAPMTLDLRMTLMAEDGNLYPFPRSQYSVLLPAGKAMDAIVQPPDPVRYALVDRMMALTNNGSSPGGMMAFLQANAVADAPVANSDGGNSTTEDHPVSMNVAGNDTATFPATIDVTTVTVKSGPYHGNAIPDGAGNVDYTSDLNYNGADSFTYTVDDTDGRTSNAATVSITVTPENDPPVAAADSYDVVEGQILNVVAPGVLGNDRDVDGDSLTAVQDTGTIVLNADGSFSFDATALLAGAADSFTYHANDGSLDSATVTVTVNVTAAPANVAPVAVDDQLQVVKGTVVDIPVLDNDYDPDGTLDPATVVIVNQPNHGKGQVTVDPVTGVITYTADPNFGGTELFTYAVMDNDGAQSNTAKVQVDLVNP